MNTSVTPWYKQFWPWFLISLPMTAVIASIITVILAVNDRDGLVKDNYYKEGLAINQDIARETTAKTLGIEANVTFDLQAKTVELKMNDAAIGNVETLQMELVHPTRSKHDMALTLTKISDNLYKSDLPDDLIPAGHWWVEVMPVNQSWLVRGRIKLPKHHSLIIN